MNDREHSKINTWLFIDRAHTAMRWCWLWEEEDDMVCGEGVTNLSAGRWGSLMLSRMVAGLGIEEEEEEADDEGTPLLVPLLLFF